MTKKRTIDPAMIDTVAQNMFHILPLIKKRLLHMDLVQREHGTPLSHVQVLAMLNDVGTMSVSEISRRLGIAKPNITPLVDRLFESGYVDRQHDENDRRVVNIVLLPAGKEKLAAIRAAYPALRTGSLNMADVGNSNLLAFIRYDSENEVIVLANNSQRAQTLAEPVAGEWIDLLTGTVYGPSDLVQIPAMGGVILVPAEKAVEIKVDYEDLAPAYDPAYIVGAEQPEPAVIATGWSGYTTWALTEDGVLTFTPSGEKLENGETNLKNYWKVNGVLTLPWSDYADQIQEVVIEDGIHDIGQMAFYELPNLKRVTLGADVTEIRNYAFKNCASLVSINLEGVDFIREGAFYGCSALENITVGEGVVVEDWAFSKTPYAPLNP